MSFILQVFPGCIGTLFLKSAQADNKIILSLLKTTSDIGQKNIFICSKLKFTSIHCHSIHSFKVEPGKWITTWRRVSLKDLTALQSEEELCRLRLAWIPVLCITKSNKSSENSKLPHWRGFFRSIIIQLILRSPAQGCNFIFSERRPG